MKDERIEIVVSAETKAAWIAAAKLRDISLSQFVRECVNAMLGRRSDGSRVDPSQC